MSSLAQVIFYSSIGGVFSLIGGFLLLANKKRARLLAEYATPFAAGALLAAAFVDLLREASHEGDIEIALVFTMIGILTFFLLERFLHWFHHHHEHSDKSSDPATPLIIIGDTLHNVIDGVAIAAGFLVGPETGIVVTLAVAAHEIPQEIGDFGLLLHKGMDKTKVIWVNVLSALATVMAAIIFFQIGQSTEVPFDIILGLLAGFFIYIAASDVIPSIHKIEARRLAGWHSALLILGAVFVSIVTISLHGYIDQGHSIENSKEAAMENHSHSPYEYDDHATLPALQIHLEEDAKSGWNLTLDTTNFTFAPEHVNDLNIPGEGHAHLYVNGEKIARLYSHYYHIDELQQADAVRVTLNANDHSEYAHDGQVIDATVIVEDGHDHDEAAGHDHANETDTHSENHQD